MTIQEFLEIMNTGVDGAVVTKDVETGAVVAGVPAKVVKTV